MNPALGDQLTASAVVVFLMQWAKNATWFPFIQKETAALNRIVAVAMAAVSTLGVNYTWVHPSPGVWTITFTGVTLAGITGAGWAWLKQFAVQELIYRGAVKKNGNGGGSGLVNKPGNINAAVGTGKSQGANPTNGGA